MGFSFRARIVLFFSLLFASVQAITLVTVYRVSRDNVIEQAGQNLAYAGRVFERLLNDYGERMAAEASILSADFGFRSTVSSGDAVTIRSALQNLMRRIHVQRAFYVELDGSVAADTGQRHDAAPFPFGDAIGRAESEGRSVSFALIDGQPHVLAIVPVLAPIPIGWIAVAARVDDRFVDHFKRLSPASLEITLAELSPHRLRLLASTLTEALQQRFERSTAGKNLAAENAPVLEEFSGSRWVTLSHPLPSARQDQAVMAILQIELETALAPYRKLWYSVAGLFGLGLVGTLLGGFAVAHQLSRPVRQLAQAAQRVGRGDFGQPISLNRRDEWGWLAQAFNLMMRGIADREARIAYQLRHDALSGLPNRLFFEERLTACIEEQCCGYAVMLVGLDRYAEINSTLGHDLGDKLIRAVGEVLQHHMPIDAALARLAGDEFALMIPSPGDEAALRYLAELILQAFDEPIAVGSATVDVSAHMGIVQCPRDGQSARALLRKADAALYLARRDGAGCQIYRQESDPCQPEALSMMGELRAGLEAGHFSLYLQPLLDLRLRRVTHAECLIRWRHPERGFMPPDRFIPLAEQTGQIGRVTAWVLNEAFRLRNEWRQAGLEVKLAVNLSAKDLLHGNLPGLLDDLLAAYPVAAGDFMLEITESAVMQDAEQALEVLEELRARGFQLAVDDFGTGYSSMAYLKKLPLNELKIDKAFVLNLAENSEDAVIVRSIIELGHNLGFKVVAEGVEDEASLTVLESQGCDLAQGYWINRPVPSAEFEDWLRQSSWPSSARYAFEPAGSGRAAVLG